MGNRDWLGRVSDAIVELEEALHLSPGNVQARRLLSRAYQRNGNKERARQYAESPAPEEPVPEGDLLGDFFYPNGRHPGNESPISGAMWTSTNALVLEGSVV